MRSLAHKYCHCAQNPATGNLSEKACSQHMAILKDMATGQLAPEPLPALGLAVIPGHSCLSRNHHRVNRSTCYDCDLGVLPAVSLESRIQQERAEPQFSTALAPEVRSGSHFFTRTCTRVPSGKLPFER